MLETFLTADVLAIAQLFISFFRLIMVPVEILELLKKETVTTLYQVVLIGGPPPPFSDPPTVLHPL